MLKIGEQTIIGLSFVTSKVKDHAIRLVNEMYEPMFLAKEE
jgi:hypothetical protein